MSETCIVCLGDLGGNANDLGTPAADPAVKSSDIDKDGLSLDDPPPPPPPMTLSNDNTTELIAHLLPCSHNLHNECLKPWVERANSCPICRQSFNQVELCSIVGGPVISSYVVADRTQVADIDPSMVGDYEDDEDLEDVPCPVCCDSDNEDVLMACDGGCGAYYHTYCVGLDAVPAGHWFCEDCQITRAIEAVDPASESSGIARHTRSRTHHLPDGRTRGQLRRLRDRNQVTSSNWARVWQSVWDNLNLDLDFPFDDGADAARVDRVNRASSQRRDFQHWERRLQVAERQGGPNRFRDTASTLLDINANREQPDIRDPESREELRAWNAFEKAKEIELDPTPKRKRKSATTSPTESEPAAEPERPLKRPRTRRNIEPTESAVEDTGSAASSSRQVSTRQPVPQNANGPSFLQSMLKEIETTGSSEDGRGRPRAPPISTNHSSPQPSSPGLSPSASNHASPRLGSATPPPPSATRPHSPLSLTSKVEPIFPLVEYSPTRSPPDTSNNRSSKNQIHQHHQVALSSSRSQDTSPSRANVPYSTKADLQKMVTAALKPHYQSNTVSKDEYTDINRNVSRMLYEKMGDAGSVNDNARVGWERMASDEVTKAVESLKASS